MNNEKRLCRTCKYEKKPEYHKLCVVYRDDCQLYKPIEEMTNEEAITIIKNEFSKYSDTLSVYAEKRKIAFDMAIKALEREVNQEKDNAYREKKWGDKNDT